MGVHRRLVGAGSQREEGPKSQPCFFTMFWKEKGLLEGGLHVKPPNEVFIRNATEL